VTERVVRRPARTEGERERERRKREEKERGGEREREKRMMGLEPTTFCMASRRSSQLSYIRKCPEYSRAF
jgi:hypothetical protein